jgi:hypothetical protein
LQVARRVGPEEFNERITRQYSLKPLKSGNHCISCRALRESAQFSFIILDSISHSFKKDSLWHSTNIFMICAAKN